MAEMVTTRSNFKVRFKPFLEVPFRVASNNKLQIIVKLDKASTIQDANDLRTYVLSSLRSYIQQEIEWMKKKVSIYIVWACLKAMNINKRN